MSKKTLLSGLFTDFYELTMAQGYFHAGRSTENATFDYFFRTNPFNGGFLIFAGLDDFLESLGDFHFSENGLHFLQKCGLNADFLNYLSTFKFGGKIYSVPEGSIVFPGEPLVRVEGNIIESQLIETLLLNTINFESLIATKAFRIKLSLGKRPFVDFGLRRAQGLGGIQATRAAIIGGASSTSNLLAAQKYELPVSGTMAHSWVQSFTSELEAFEEYAKINPDNTILLIDTYDTLNSGLPNAVKVGQRLKASGNKLKGVRLDSGDLAVLSKAVRCRLDQEGLEKVKIVVSNQLNEYVIKKLLEQDAPIDAFGVGTELMTGKPDAALDGVYKLTECNGEAKMKFSDDRAKQTLPGTKRLYRFCDKDGSFCCDGIYLADESPDKSDKNSLKLYKLDPPNKELNLEDLAHENLAYENLDYHELQQLVYAGGKILIKQNNPLDIHQFLLTQAAKLDPKYKRIVNPQTYNVGISPKLSALSRKLQP
ncbi:MAG: nicotinate phosphoribosyltransferase [Pseudomonadota bacterium]|nr:nicotinate phosphoribosyltransferase [Pseudomonadota bacterium]